MTRPRLNPPTPAAVFAGGRAPACWRREVRRTTAAPAALARACGWVGELAREPRPRLRRQPLLGHCLAELVDAAPPEAPPAAPAEPPRARPPVAHGAPGDRPKGDHAATTAGHKQPTPPAASSAGHGPARGPKSAATAAGQPAKATPELLARLGGPARSRPAAAGAHGGRRATPGRGSTPGHGTAPAKAATPERRPPPAERAGHELPARLAERVRQRALLAGPEPQDKETGAPSAARPRPDAANDLAAQWRGSLDGQRAPAGWLAAPGNAHGRAPAPSAAPEPRAPGQPPTADERRAAGVRAGQATPPALPAARHARRAAGHAAAREARRGSGARLDPPGEDGAGDALYAEEGSAAASRDGRLEADDGQVVSVVSRFAPPQLADTLPPLRPPGPGAVAMPVAAAAARRSALREEGAVVEDLDELAGKLRRLLEEEARRHGIDI